MDSLLAAKITAMVVLFCITALVGAVPFMLNCCLKWTESTNPRTVLAVQCLLQFGGGVLLCTTFVHLLPEVQGIVDGLLYCNFIPQLKFALAETLMCAGFFLMYFVEECIHFYLHKHQKGVLAADEKAVEAFERAHSLRNSVLVKDEGTARSASVTATIGLDVESVMAAMEAAVNTNNSNTNTQSSSDCLQHAHSAVHSHLPVEQLNQPGGVTVTSSMRGLLIVLALSLHELFEGLAIGLEESTSAVWYMFGAIAAHKLVLAFCVGVELLVARTRPLLSVLYMLIFSIVSPIGIAVGIIITAAQDSTAPSLTSAILQGLACGTLLYVVFFEIMSKEHTGFLTFSALLIGFLVMFGLMQIGDDDDGPINCGYSYS